MAREKMQLQSHKVLNKAERQRHEKYEVCLLNKLAF